MMAFVAKGLLRDRSRSLFPVIMVATGAFLTVLLYSYMQGVIGDMVDAGARFDNGHVKIMTRAYGEIPDQMPNDLALLDSTALLAELTKTYPDMIWTPRIRFGGLIDIADKAGETRDQGPFLGLGVDLVKKQSLETALLKLNKALVRGHLPETSDEILISEEFARKLNVEVNQTVSFISSTMYGSMAVANFKVSGTVVFGISALDRNAVIADLEGIRKFLDMEDAAGEILGFSKDMVYADQSMKALSDDFSARFTASDDEFAPVMHPLSSQGVLKEILGMFNSIGAIIVAVFVMAMSIVLWNAGLMNGLRRYGEIGVRLALGESKGDVYIAMVLEAVIIGISGSIIGTALGLGVSYWMQIVGMDFSGIFHRSAIMMTSVLRCRVTPTSYGIGFIPGLFASVIGTMFAGIGIFRRQTAQLFKELEV